MRFHVVGLPHAKTTRDFETCAFTEKVRKFCKMMRMEHHEVFLYSAGDRNEAECTEWISCLPEQERVDSLNGEHFTCASFDCSLPHWRRFNDNAIRGIRNRTEHDDFICVIGGVAHKQIADAFPDLLTVEFGIGYPGTFADFRVWESYAWMHTCYGTKNTNAGALDGHWYDEVIPSYFEPELFPFVGQPSDYYLYIGRIIDRKGWQIAVETTKAIGAKLKLAGPGYIDPEYLKANPHVEYVGIADATQRADLMGHAIAQFTPTIYIEPFGSVAVEAQICGTPVITTDWGAFTETIVPHFNGYRCRYLGDFIRAAEDAKSLDRVHIREHAVRNYSLDAIAPRYTSYFRRLRTVWGDGWYTKT